MNEIEQWWDRFVRIFEERFWNPYHDPSDLDAILEEGKKYVK